jgi:hypothetical protein
MAQKRHAARRAKYLSRSKIDQQHRARLEVRICCSTSWREPHLASCRRSHRCRDKVGYSGRAVAKQAAVDVSTEHGTVLTEYLCDECGLYHIGHPFPGQRGWDEAVG